MDTFFTCRKRAVTPQERLENLMGMGGQIIAVEQSGGGGGNYGSGQTFSVGNYGSGNTSGNNGSSSRRANGGGQTNAFSGRGYQLGGGS